MATDLVMTRDQFTALKSWHEANGKEWPEEIRALYALLFSLFNLLVTMKSKHVQLLARLREAMRLSPKSESGRQIISKR